MDINLKWSEIVLGSQSPRRRELLAGLDLDFRIEVADIDETFPNEIKVEQVAEFIANNKLIALEKHRKGNELIICSDTIVVLDQKILGKPNNRTEATQMLQLLSGKEHRVISAVAMSDGKKKQLFSDQTTVTFKVLSESEITYYLDHYQPYDKAGSYGVQEWIGMMGITKMEGSYFTVMGLPVHQIYERMTNW